MGSPAPARAWVFPVADSVTAEVILRGGQFSLAQIRTLIEHLRVLEHTLLSPAAPAAIELEHVELATEGDLVQLRSTADPVFGGLVLRVTQSRTLGVRGYLLVPHRGGCRDAWQRLKHCEYERVGRVRWPEAEWGFRTAGTGPRARLWSDDGNLQKRPPGVARSVQEPDRHNFRQGPNTAR